MKKGKGLNAEVIGKTYLYGTGGGMTREEIEKMIKLFSATPKPVKGNPKIERNPFTGRFQKKAYTGPVLWTGFKGAEEFNKAIKYETKKYLNKFGEEEDI